MKQNPTRSQPAEKKKIDDIRASILKASADKIGDEAYQDYLKEKEISDRKTWEFYLYANPTKIL